MTKPLGLTAALSKALREHVDQQLDAMLAETLSNSLAGFEAAEREAVDAVRRWAERREEALFPTGRPIESEPTNGHGKELCPECGQPVVQEER